MTRSAHLEFCAKLLTSRPRSEHELRQALSQRGLDADGCAEVLQRLRELGYVDDARLAQDYIGARAQRLAHGPERLLRELEQRGVAPTVARSAWDELVRRGELNPQALLDDAVRRRLGADAGRLPLRQYRRVYNALLRAGFRAPEVIQTLKPFRPRSRHLQRDEQDEYHDEFP